MSRALSRAPLTGSGAVPQDSPRPELLDRGDGSMEQVYPDDPRYEQVEADNRHGEAEPLDGIGIAASLARDVAGEVEQLDGGDPIPWRVRERELQRQYRLGLARRRRGAQRPGRRGLASARRTRPRSRRSSRSARTGPGGSDDPDPGDPHDLDRRGTAA